jgi:hypothetical protein
MTVILMATVKVWMTIINQHIVQLHLRAATSEHGGLVMKAAEFARQVGTTCATRASCSAMKLTKGGAACGILVELVADEQRTHASNAVFMCAWPILSSFTNSKFCLC